MRSKFVAVPHIFVAHGTTFSAFSGDPVLSPVNINSDPTTENSFDMVGMTFGDRNEKIIICAGYNPVRETCFIYNFETDTRHNASSMSMKRGASAGTKMVDGRFWVTGGNDQGGGGYQATSEIYDPDTDTWSVGPTLPDQRINHCLVRLYDDRDEYIMFGGRAATCCYDTAFIFDATETWVPAANMQYASRVQACDRVNA